jgi:molecular chaperone HscB
VVNRSPSDAGDEPPDGNDGPPTLIDATSVVEADAFERLGLPRQHDLSRDAIEQAYLERAQLMHPDRFASVGPRAQRLAMEASAALNEAHRVIRDPVRRAEYLCKLAGIDVDSNDPGRGAPTMGQAFLIEMIERREALEDARVQGQAALEGLRRGVEDELDGALDAAVRALDADDPQDAARCLVKHRYFQRLLDEIDGGTEH